MKLRPLFGRFTQHFPVTLIRYQPLPIVQLREFERQQRKNSPLYDFHLGKDGLIHPMTGSYFKQPNGMSLIPLGEKLSGLINSFHGRIFIYLIKEGTKIPENLVLLHEFVQHFSLQTSVPCKEAVLNERLTQFLKENAKQISKSECLQMCESQKVQS